MNVTGSGTPQQSDSSFHTALCFMSHVKCYFLSAPGANDPFLEEKELVDRTYPTTLVLSCHQSPAELQPQLWGSCQDFRRERLISMWIARTHYKFFAYTYKHDQIVSYLDNFSRYRSHYNSRCKQSVSVVASVSNPQILKWKREHLCPFAEGLCSEYIFFECWYFYHQKFAERQAFWTEVSCTIVVVPDHLRLEQIPGRDLR